MNKSNSVLLILGTGIVYFAGILNQIMGLYCIIVATFGFGMILYAFTREVKSVNKNVLKPQ